MQCSKAFFNEVEFMKNLTEIMRTIDIVDIMNVVNIIHVIKTNSTINAI